MLFAAQHLEPPLVPRVTEELLEAAGDFADVSKVYARCRQPTERLPQVVHGVYRFYAAPWRPQGLLGVRSTTIGAPTSRSGATIGAHGIFRLMIPPLGFKAFKGCALVAA